MIKVDGARAQAFAHKIVEFAEPQVCADFFQKHEVDMDLPNDQGWTVLMSVCAKGAWNNLVVHELFGHL